MLKNAGNLSSLMITDFHCMVKILKNFSQNIFFYAPQKKDEDEWWQNFNFWEDYPFNMTGSSLLHPSIKWDPLPQFSLTHSRFSGWMKPERVKSNGAANK